MLIYRERDYDAMSRKAASILSALVVLKPACVLGLATGSSPIGAYKQLIEWNKMGELDFSEVSTVNLDEYKGLSPENDQSYRYFMRTNLFDYINIRQQNTYLPNGMAEDGEEECRQYDGIIDKLGGIDIQLLGIGHNGHIGFNEPGDSFKIGTHLTALTESTINANKRFFENVDQMPRYALTMGIGSIMKARRILLIASGKEKADIVREAFYGPVTPHVPASVLQLHNNVILVGDNDALSKM